jgi:hypothetical protein
MRQDTHLQNCAYDSPVSTFEAGPSKAKDRKLVAVRCDADAIDWKGMEDWFVVYVMNDNLCYRRHGRWLLQWRFPEGFSNCVFFKMLREFCYAFDVEEANRSRRTCVGYWVAVNISEFCEFELRLQE